MRIDKIPDDAVLIKGTIDEYVDPRGNVYGHDHRCGHRGHPYQKELNEVWGYYYVKINYTENPRSRRVHRVVAETFIDNPNELPIVMHKDNNKKNNCVENLKWGTISENTKQAFDDGLAKNDSGIEDSQSVPCCMYETATNKFIASFGSIKEAARNTGLCASTIARQVKHPEMPIRKKVYFTAKEEGARAHFVVAKMDYKTDALLASYSNVERAAKENNVSSKLVSEQCCKKRKPKWTNLDYYFKRIYLKCEEIIEIKNESRVENR